MAATRQWGNACSSSELPSLRQCSKTWRRSGCQAAVDPGVIGTLSNNLRRLLQTIGLQRVPKPVTALEYLSALERAAPPSNDDDDNNDDDAREVVEGQAGASS